MQNEVEYPFVPGKGGVDFGDLKKRISKDGSFVGDIDGASGRKLIASITPYYFEVSDAARPELVLSSWVDEAHSLHFNIRTKEDTERRHPDLHARQFVSLALQHFKSADRIVGTWVTPSLDEPESTNYEEYMRRKAEGKSKSEAAASTWSGRVFSDLGFNIDRVEEHPRKVDAVFVRVNSKY